MMKLIKLLTLGVLSLFSVTSKAQSNLNNIDEENAVGTIAVGTINGTWCNGNTRFLGSTTNLINTGYSCNSSLTECVYVTVVEEEHHKLTVDNVTGELYREAAVYSERKQIYFIEGDALYAKTVSSVNDIDGDGLTQNEKISPAYYRCE